MARPKFSKFREISEKISKSIADKDSHHSIAKEKPYSRISKTYNDQKVPIGFALDGSCPLIVNNVLQSLRFQTQDFIALSQHSDNISCQIETVSFPLVAVLLPRWLKSIEKEFHNDRKKVVVLVSGRGTPRLSRMTFTE